MAVVIPQFDPRVTVVNTLSGGVNTSDRALLDLRSAEQVRSAQGLQGQLSSRIDAALARLNSSGNSATIDALLREQSQLASRRDRITEAVTVIQKSLAQFDYLKNHVAYLRDQLDQLENGDLTASEVGVEWDNKLRKINQLSDAAAQIVKDGKNYYPKNLIDSRSRTSFATQDIYAPYNAQGQTYQVTGVFLGTDYYITDSGGDFWNSNTGYAESEEAVGILAEYTSYSDSPTGVSDSVTGITLNSFNRSTGAVDFTLSDATNVTGTVTRGGLGLLDAFLYANFDTGVDADAIDNARDDLDAAEALLLTTEYQYKQDLATLESRSDVFATKIDGIGIEISNLVTNLRNDGEAELLAAQLQFAVTQFNYTLLAGRGNTLIRSIVLAQDNAQPSSYDTVATGEAIAGARVDIRA